MDIDSITIELNKRFAAPLQEFYTRRIIFWRDEEQEFEDKLDALQLDNAKLLVLTGNNFFAVKKLLAVDDIGSNYLVYDPLPHGALEDNWLLNLELCNEEFRSDHVSIWMGEIGLPDTPALRKTVKEYRKFFNAKERRGKISVFAKNIATASQLHLAVLATVANSSDIRPTSIIKAVLVAKESILQSFKDYNCLEPFWKLVNQAIGYASEEALLQQLAMHLLLTAATRTLAPNLLAGLEAHFDEAHQAFCYDLVSEWLHSEDAPVLLEYALMTERELHLAQRFDTLPIQMLMDTDCFPCIHIRVLKQLMADIHNETSTPEEMLAILTNRRSKPWATEFADYFEGVTYAISMLSFAKDHIQGFHNVEPEKIWEAYTKDYYRMDTAYRLFHLNFSRSLVHPYNELDDSFKALAEQMERLYVNWFLEELGNNWTKACATPMAKFGRIPNVLQQENFYDCHIRSVSSKIFVIISDAFRYEVAVSLSEQLRQETQAKIELNNCEAIFPTVTKFGMAALLPHRKLTLKEGCVPLAVLADDKSTESGDRDALLKSMNSKSVALRYEDLIGKKRAERQAYVKGMDVVYIYHDIIDKASHTSDSMVFPACEDSLAELKNLVRIIVNDFGGIHIIITADHGFLYTNSVLREDDKVDKSTLSSQELEAGRRYIITKPEATEEYLLPVKFLNGATEAKGFTPRENIRIKKKGGGLNYIHGGISLQEMVVPVLEYTYLRNESKAYLKNKDMYDTKPVTLGVLSASRKISNMVFSLTLYQKDAVAANREAATYRIFFTDAEGGKISDEQKVIADKTTSNVQERALLLKFNLKQLKYDKTASYYLVIADESGLQPPIREEFQIDIAFAVDEFDFFGN